MELQNSGNGNDVSARISNTGSGGTTLESNRTITDTEWHHYAGVFSGATGVFQIFIDGVLDKEVSTGYSSFWPVQASIELGGWPTSGFSDTFMNGKLDEVRIYSRALSPDEVKRLYKIGSTLKYGAPNSSGSLSSGLVGWWTFDGNDVAGVTAYDRSGQGNSGTTSASGGAQKVIGKIGQAMKFDGVDDYVQAGHSSSLSLTNWTISAWVKFDINSGALNQFIAERGGISSTRINYYLWFDSNGDTCGAPASFVFGFRNSADTAFIDHCYTFTPEVGRWYHLVVTYNGANIPFYIDGVRVVNDAETATPNITGNQPLLIGSENDFSNRIQGAIDDARIYNRTLTADEIKRLYKMGSTLKQGAPNSSGSLASGLVGWWTFDGNDVAGVTALDRSGRGNNGTLTAGPTRAIGKIGQALAFDGTNDYVLISNESQFDFNLTDKFSISVWVKSGKNTNEVLASKQDSSSPYPGWFFAINTADGLDNSAGTLYFELVNNYSSNNAIRVRSTNAVSNMNDGSFHHYMLTYDGSTFASGVRFYADGVLFANTVVFDGLNASTLNDISPQLGVWNATTFPMQGALDDIRIYNRALSPDEIKRLYNMGR